MMQMRRFVMNEMNKRSSFTSIISTSSGAQIEAIAVTNGRWREDADLESRLDLILSFDLFWDRHLSACNLQSIGSPLERRLG